MSDNIPQGQPSAAPDGPTPRPIDPPAVKPAFESLPPRRSRWTAVIVGLIAVGLLGVGAYFVVQKIREAQQPPVAGGRQGGGPIAVEVAPIQHGEIRDVRILTGSLQARSQFQIASRIAGRLEQLGVDIGDTVERGQLVAVMDDQEHQQQVEQARAEVMVAQANLDEKTASVEIVQREFNRAQQLHQQQIASDAELDAARSRLQAEQAAVRVAEAQLARHQAALAAAEVRLAYTQIRAQWQQEGSTRVVGERFVDEGATVAANAPLFSLLDLDTLTAVVYVTDAEYRRIGVGQRADLVDAAGADAGTAGRVARIAPLFREGSRQARVEIEVPNHDRTLTPGAFIRVRLELGHAPQATIVPRQALVRRENRQGVFVADAAGNIARFVPITTGIIERDRVQVLEPSIEGHVVTLGQHLLSDGAAIRIVSDEPPARTTPRREVRQ